jgi:hypothetical protein
MLLSTGKIAVLDFMAILIEKLIADQMAGPNLLRKKRVPLIHVQGIEIPLHWPMLCDSHYEFGGLGHAEGSQEYTGEVPEDEHRECDADNQPGAAGAAR